MAVKRSIAGRMIGRSVGRFVRLLQLIRYIGAVSVWHYLLEHHALLAVLPHPRLQGVSQDGCWLQCVSAASDRGIAPLRIEKMTPPSNGQYTG